MRQSTVAAASFERRYFEENYRNYSQQNPFRKLLHYKQAIEESLPGRERIRLLDVGCAFGAFLGTLDERWDAYGADVSEYAIESAKQTVPAARFEKIRDGRIPFAVSFDAVTAWDVIEHIPDLEALAREIRTHLADDGVFVFVVPVYDGPLGPVVRLLDGDPTHVHKKSRQFWLDWAGRHFEVQKWWGVFRYLCPGGYYIHSPTRGLRRIAPAIAVVARQAPAGRQR
jgi:SAM-dependent methyltransferase